MSQLDRIKEGIRRAHAAGDAEAVKKLGAAYRQLQAQPSSSSAPTSETPPLKPGTREYANWAREQALAGKELPMVSSQSPKFFPERDSSLLDPFVQGTTFGWGDELRGAVQGGLAALQGGDFGDTYARTVDDARQKLEYQRRTNPIGSFAAEFAGAIPTGVGLGGKLVGSGTTLGARALSGAGVGAAQGVAYGAGAADDDKRVEGGMLGGALGGIVGGAAPYVGAAARRLVTPLPASKSRLAAADILKKEGVNLTAGQRTGSKKLLYAESELGGGAADNFMEQQADQFTAAALRKAGIEANRATPEVIDDAFARIGGEFEVLQSRNAMALDDKLADELTDVVRRYRSITSESQRVPIVDEIIKDLIALEKQGNPQALAGEAYQRLRSNIEAAARSTKASDVAEVLRDLKRAFDDATERWMKKYNPGDLGAWKEARRQYRNMLVLEDAATRAGQASAEGIITPQALRSSAIRQGKRGYARGKSDFTELANAGVTALTPLPQSGTAPRLAARALAAIPAAIGVGLGTPGGLPGMAAGAVAGAAFPAMAGRALLSKPGRALLSNQLLAGSEPGVIEKLLRSSAPLVGSR